MKKLIVASFALLFGFSCTAKTSNKVEVSQQNTSFESIDQNLPVDDTIQESKLIVASFNIQNFGKTKMRERPLVIDTLISIFLKYDVIAVQEISHKNGDTPKRFLDSLNKYYKDSFDMLISERSGLQTDDISSQEQYGFYFKKDKIQKLDEGVVYPDEENDFFQREPYMAHFKSADGDFDFVLITVHTAPAKSGNPDITLNEVGALDEVIKWAKIHYSGEKDFIVVGDFNADCSYVDEDDLEGLDIKKNYTWLIPNTEKTNLAKGSDCTYDRIVITGECNENFNGSWGVDRCFTSKTVSDHWPVWAEFRVFWDND